MSARRCANWNSAGRKNKQERQVREYDLALPRRRLNNRYVRLPERLLLCQRQHQTQQDP